MTMISTAAIVLSAAMTLAPPQQPQPFGPAPQSGRGSATSTLQGFNIVLVAGEMQPQGSAPDDNVPAAARKALNDMKDFLPFKHYRLLDSQWTLCCSADAMPITGILRGTLPPDSHAKFTRTLEYAFQLVVRRDADPAKLPIYFTLRSPSRSTSSGQSGISQAREAEMEKRVAELRRELDSLEDEISRRRQAVGEKHPDLVGLEAQRRRIAQRIDESRLEIVVGQQERRTPPASAALIDSNFTMDVGETVVVGTSAIGGDKALIAIVTAVRKGTR